MSNTREYMEASNTVVGFKRPTVYERYLPYTNDEELTERIIEWNRVRNGLEFNPALEIRMLSEETCELLEYIERYE